MEKLEADYREPVSFTKFVNLVIGKVEEGGPGPPPSVTDLVQLMVSRRDSDLY